MVCGLQVGRRKVNSDGGLGVVNGSNPGNIYKGFWAFELGPWVKGKVGWGLYIGLDLVLGLIFRVRFGFKLIKPKDHKCNIWIFRGLNMYTSNSYHKDQL